MDNMIERVARAICTATGENPDRVIALTFVPPHRYAWMKYREHAVAAIAAMREPTAEMVKAMLDVIGPRDPGPAGAAWIAMIDAVLANQPRP